MLTRMPITLKLPFIMLAVTALTVLGVDIAGYEKAAGMARENAVRKLTAASSSNGRKIENLLASIQADLTINASNPMVSQALRRFRSALRKVESPAESLQAAYIDANPYPEGERHGLVEGADNSMYDKAHAYFHPAFRRIRAMWKYRDILLIDAAGNIVYTVRKERDFGTNVLTGPLADTPLAHLFKAAKEQERGDPPVFSGFGIYQFGEATPSAFVGLPVFDELGARTGVLAYQLPLDALNEIVARPDALGISGETYLSDASGAMLTDSPRSEQFSPLRDTVMNPAVAAGIEGRAGTAEFTDRFGHEVMASYLPINGFGQRWVLVSKEDTAELFRPVGDMRDSFLLIGGVAILIAGLVSVLFSRSIARPVSAVGTAMTAIADKSYETEVPATRRGDEIGSIARTLEEFRRSLAAAEEAGRAATFRSAAFEKSSAAMMLVDADFRIIHLNGAVRELMSQTADSFAEAIGSADLDSLVGQSMDKFHLKPDRVRAILTRNGSLPHTAVVKIGGTFLSLAVNGVAAEDGTMLGYVLEWKIESQSLRHSTIISALDDFSVRIEITADGRIGWANRFVCQEAATEVSALLDRDAGELIEHRPASGTALNIARLVESAEPMRDDFALRLPNGEMVINATIMPNHDPQGKPCGVIMLGNDVTEERRALAEAEAERQRAAAAQAKVVETLRQALTQLSNGDLSARIETAFAGEYEQLRADFNMATEKLCLALSEIVGGAASIRADTENISATTQSLSKRTETQASTLEETAAALDHLTRSVGAAAEAATSAAGMVQDTRENVQTSGGVVHQAVGAMGEIEKFATEISSISTVIDEIAFQTNLLALNAGVEAARAGEAGRGFAVVASEVRALAQRSSDAAREINSLISSSGAQITKGVSLVSEAGEVLNQMMASVAQIADSVQGIAQEATEQARGLQEINTAVTRLDQVTQNNAAMFEQTTAASMALAGEAEGLTRNMAQFRIEAGTAADDARQAAAARPGLAKSA